MLTAAVRMGLRWARERHFRIALGALGIPLCGFLLAAPVLLPAAELSTLSQRTLFADGGFADSFRPAPWEV